MAMTENGAPEERSAVVAKCLRETTDIIERWIRQAEENESCPVWKYTSSEDMRSQFALPSLDEKGCQEEALLAHMQTLLDNSVNPWTGRFLDKLYTAPVPQGPAFEALLTAINANAHIFTAAPVLCLCEEACVEGLAILCGWDTDAADGLTMPGGSSSNTFAIQTALNTLLPTFKQDGIVGAVEQIQRAHPARSLKACQPLIFTGQEAHYSLEKAAISCGLGLKSVVKVPCDVLGAMDHEELERLLTEAYENTSGDEGTSEQKRVVGWPVFVNATSGSTVTGSFDALDKIADVCNTFSQRSKSKVWLHADGSWGGPVLFSKTNRNKMHGIAQFDSLTINPHKLLNVPHQCSFVVLRDGDCLANNALDAPYLFHGDSSSSGNDDVLARKRRRRESPAMMNFGCGRRGDALKFYLSWLAQGSDGFERQVDQGIAKAQEVVRRISQDTKLNASLELSVSTVPTFLQVCYRPRLDDKASVEDKSRATRYVYAMLRKQKRFSVDFAPLGRGEGDFIRMVTHPSSSLQTLMELVEEVAKLGNDFLSGKDVN